MDGWMDGWMDSYDDERGSVDEYDDGTEY
jgi:hypothetical protein